MTPQLQIDILPSDSLSTNQRAAIIALCSRAYDEDFSALFDVFDAPTHIVATLDDHFVSHALWISRPLHYYDIILHSAYVEAVATEPAYQGRGYASAVLQALAQAITTYDIGALSPSEPAFYSRLGWEVWQGDLYVAQEQQQQPTPNDVVMILRLPTTLLLDLRTPLTAPWREGDIW